MSSKVKVAVVGAGASGLVSLKYMLCLYADKFDPVAFERNEDLGGVWRHTSDTTKVPLSSAIYDNLRTNVPKEIIPFEGLPFPDHLPSYVHHSDFLKYLEDFADYFNLRPHIIFNTEVIEVLPKPSSSSFLDGTSWDVTARNLKTGKETTENFEAVIVCNGHHTVPIMNIEGSSNFKGIFIHSQAYRNPEPFRSQDVLIVGSSFSGIDICFEVIRVAKTVYLSQRRKKFVTNPSIPKNLVLTNRTSRILEDGSVLFDDGQILKVDSVIVCTGYEYGFPFLSADCGVGVADHRVTPLYKHIINIRHPSMAFIGLNILVLPLVNCETQIKFVLSVYAGTTQLPDEEAMLADEEAELQEKLRKGWRVGDGHFLGSQQWDYYRMLAKMGKFEPPDPLIEKIYIYNVERWLKDVMRYKDYNFEIIDREKCLFKTYPINTD